MNKGASFGTVVLVLILASVLAAGGAVVWSVRQVTQPLAAAERAVQKQIAQVVHPTPTISPDPVTIVKEVQGLSRLETAAYTIEKIVTAESQQGPLAFLLGDRLILVAHGQVIAGVDLDELTGDDVTVGEDGVVHVSLPEAEVFVAALSSEDSYIFDRDTGVLGQKVDLETQARQAAEAEIRRAALEDGILDMAQRNAEVTVRRLIRTLGFDDVRFAS
jgi:hypothetical protein